MKGKGIVVLIDDSIFFNKEGIFSYFFEVEDASKALEVDTSRGKTIGGTLYHSKEDPEYPPSPVYF